MPEVTGSSPVSSTIYSARHKTTLAQFVKERYWPVACASLAPSWRATVESFHLPCILDDLGRHPLVALTPERIEAWWGRQQTRHRSPTSANKCLTRLKHILRKAVVWRLLTENPAQHIRKGREPRGRVRWLTNEQRMALLNGAPHQLKWYILFALYTGGRRRSLHSLREEDVNLEQGIITFRHTKTGDDHIVPLHPLLSWIVPLRLTGNPVAPLLPRLAPASISRGFRRLARRVGLYDFRFHDLRHDLGSRLAMHGESQRLIMDVLGHKDPRMSLRYTHVSQAYVRSRLSSLE